MVGELFRKKKETIYILAVLDRMDFVYLIC